MTVLAAIADWSIFAFGLLLFAVQTVAHEFGYWLGWRNKARGREAHAEGVGLGGGAMLGM